jgi:hypothetical protein
MIEDKKVEFEERLTQKIVDMRRDLTKLLRRVRDDFSRYGDYDQVATYCEVRRLLESFRTFIKF